MAEFTLKDTPEDYVAREDRPEFKATILPEERKFLVEVLEVTEKESPWFIDKNKPELGKEPQISFKFSVLVDEKMSEEEAAEWKDTWVWGNTKTDFFDHPDCRLRNWAMAIIGVEELPPGFTVDTDALEGMTCALTVSHREGKDKKTGEQKVYQNVADVIPAVDADGGGEALGVF